MVASTRMFYPLYLPIIAFNHIRVEIFVWFQARLRWWSRSGAWRSALSSLSSARSSCRSPSVSFLVSRQVSMAGAYFNMVNARCVTLYYESIKNKVVASCVFVFSEIFPYLVVIIGLENVLVVTKSVVSTPVHLEVKLRVAQGQRQLMFFFVVCKNYFLILYTFSLFNFLSS